MWLWIRAALRSCHLILSQKPNFGKSNDGSSQNFEDDVPALRGHDRTSRRAGGRERRVSSILKRCSHGRRKGACAECDPCPHGKVKSSCVACTPCPHGKVKGNCAACNPCPHGKRKYDCVACNPCPHGKLKNKCAACKTARADQPEITQEPEIKQEPFTIRGYFGFDDGR